MSDVESETTAVPENVGGFSDEMIDELEGLLDQVDRDVVGWQPEVGDKVFGKLVDINEAETDYGRYPLLIIQRPPGDLIGVHCFHTILKKDIERRLSQGTLRSGDLIAISYRGEGKAGSGGKSAAALYRVAVKRQYS